MTRKVVLTILVLALGLSVPLAEAKKAAGPSAGVSVVKGTLSAVGTPAAFQGAGALCLSRKCNVSKAKTRFEIVGKMTQSMRSRCLGIGWAGFKVFWPNGATSYAYLDVLPLTGKSITGNGTILSGPLKRARVVLTIWATADPCSRPSAISGLVAIS